MSNLSDRTICTHSETFHCDEVAAIAMLQYVFNVQSITRTRDKDAIAKHQDLPTSIVVDVGHVYDHGQQCYDHHQSDFYETFSPSYDIPMSSCGLVYKHYGKEIIKIMCTKLNIPLDKINMDYVYFKIYTTFVQPIDAIDNGINYSDGQHVERYQPLTISAIVSGFNGDVTNSAEQDVRFKEVVKVVHTVINRLFISIIDKNYRYEKNSSIFKKAWDINTEANKSHGVLVLPERMDANSYLQEYDPHQTIKFIVVPRDNEVWNIWTVRKERTGFAILAPLISQEQAIELTSPESVVFIHKALFTGATRDLKSAVKIAYASFKMDEVGYY